MNLSVPALRWQLVGALVGVTLLVAAPAASAAPSPRAAPGQAQAVPGEVSAPGPAAFYRGIQGGNLCLLARCTVGDAGTGGRPGPSNTQGFNLCLLALCTVRP
ncbi:hypothetical protein [Streptomyces sp. S8]|uniref:hypothetical protein n=1 Tax=Streptomyces sp. S8 TaxID=1837283 RepID=UPI000A0F9389|nr:hypothetical protein [Streptomyces sp. S8]